MYRCCSFHVCGSLNFTQYFHLQIPCLFLPLITHVFCVFFHILVYRAIGVDLVLLMILPIHTSATNYSIHRLLHKLYHLYTTCLLILMVTLPQAILLPTVSRVCYFHILLGIKFMSAVFFGVPQRRYFAIQPFPYFFVHYWIIGADYMIQGSSVYAYASDIPNQWAWNFVGSINADSQSVQTVVQNVTVCMYAVNIMQDIVTDIYAHWTQSRIIVSVKFIDLQLLLVHHHYSIQTGGCNYV